MRMCEKRTCTGCTKEIEGYFDSTNPVESFKCHQCRHPENYPDPNRPKKEIDGAPAGFVRGGISNRAGFSTGKVFTKYVPKADSKD